jgi:hypothetical protein
MAYGNRPAGVTFVAVLAWLSGTLHIVLGGLVLGRVLSSSTVTDEVAWASIIVGVIVFLVSLGLFSGSNLARMLVTISLALSILSAVTQIVADSRPDAVVGPVISGAAAILGVIMLYTGRASRFFGTR